MNVLTWIVIGLISGWLAGVAMKGGGFGIVGDIIVGVVGALLGGFLASKMLNIANPVSGFNLETILVAFLGSVLVIFILRLFNWRRFRV
jgi:uncharacterized membrane protein YeaQ/YmgE (transglycosylase-associated protein family)